MTEPPRRLPRTPAQQVAIAIESTVGAAGADSRFNTQVRGDETGRALPTFEEVFHGDDGTVMRPPAAKVMWYGAATPLNGAAGDFWYSATI